jgi:hypothetical protein
MDLKKLSTGDKVIGVSGILLFIFSFFPWLGFSFGGFSESRSAWTFTLCWIAVILGVALVIYVILKMQGVNLPSLGSITWNQVALGVATLAAVLILIKIITGPGTGGVDISGTGIDKERKIGIFLGFIASLGLVGGAFMNLRESDELPGRSSSGDAVPPAA